MVMVLSKIIIGLTGTFASGCTFISRKFIESLGYKYISLSDILREEYKNNNGEDAEGRTKLQDFGNELRQSREGGVLASLGIELIEKGSHEKWIVDSIRNPYEIKMFVNNTQNFIY